MNTGAPVPPRWIRLVTFPHFRGRRTLIAALYPSPGVLSSASLLKSTLSVSCLLYYHMVSLRVNSRKISWRTHQERKKYLHTPGAYANKTIYSDQGLDLYCCRQIHNAHGGWKGLHRRLSWLIMRCICYHQDRRRSPHGHGEWKGSGHDRRWWALRSYEM